MKVLISAPDLNPDWPSLPGVIYRYLNALCPLLEEPVVVTFEHNREALERTPLLGAKVVYLPNGRPLKGILGALVRRIQAGNTKGWTFRSAMGRKLIFDFEKQVYERFADSLHQNLFDLVHRVSPMSPVVPSYLAMVSPRPVVLGPLNGGLKWPAGYRHVLLAEREYLHWVRFVAKWYPSYQKTFRGAKLILAGFAHTRQDLPRLVRHKVVDFPEVGIEAQKFFPPSSSNAQGGMAMIYVGRLAPLKQVDVVIEAMGRSEILRRQRLTIVGEGPEKAKLQALVAHYGLSDQVTFTGHLPHAQVAEAMARADIFVFPSIKELGAGGLIEAMASGLAPVVIDYGAPGHLVAEGCGIRIPLGSREQLVRGYMKSLEQLVLDPQETKEMGRRAFRKSKRYRFAEKAKATLSLYEKALAGSGLG